MDTTSKTLLALLVGLAMSACAGGCGSSAGAGAILRIRFPTWHTWHSRHPAG